MAEDSISLEPLEELQKANTRLRLLVCELLLKNEELRGQLSAKNYTLHKHQLSGRFSTVANRTSQSSRRDVDPTVSVWPAVRKLVAGDSV
jgi:hypothetical protein